ncbi:MAG: WD40 repeat domain-containing protein [Methylobacteriaceae bacterium]|nr:WD40 repeat domain-containing protein [Methylobacteriaceae bacterium]
MTDHSLISRVAPIEAGAHVVAAAFLADAPALALADGAALLGAPQAPRRIALHPEATLLVAAHDARRLVAGGDDGRVVALSADGATTLLGDEKGRWIDAVALRADGATAWSAQREVRARDAAGATRSWTAPSSVRGLAFLPKGYRLAAAHYNGVSLWFPNVAGPPEALVWKGSHLDCAVSPDGRFVVTSMQENALHGWRLADRKDMRMTGYPSKTRSFSWSHDGNWLATSGADAAIVWPFRDKDGPMGKAPSECGARPAKVSTVAFHPGALVLAIGYEDGWIILSRLTDASELPVRAPAQENRAGAITALAWDAKGRRLLFGAADGAAGLLTLPD